MDRTCTVFNEEQALPYVQQLLANGFDVDSRNDIGETMLMVATGNDMQRLSTLLLNSGVGVDLADSEGFSALFHAKTVDMVNLLVSRGAGVNHRARSGLTPLLLFCQNGKVDIARTLLEYGADINVEDSDGWTPLMYACFRGEDDLAEMLVKSGADVNVRDEFGADPLSIATKNCNEATIDLLVQFGAE